MTFSVDVTLIFEEVLRLQLSDVDDFLDVKIVTESLKLMKRYLTREALNFVDDLNEVSPINDENELKDCS